MIKIEYKSKGSLKDIIPQLSDVKKALRLTGALYLQKQRGRIRSGQDVGGNAFIPYSEEYLAHKTGAGRKAQPDLRLTGEMLRSQKIKVSSIGKSSGRMLIEFDGERSATWFKSKGVYKRGNKKTGKKKGKTKGYTVAKKAKTVSNAKMAHGNNRLRPFIGQTKKGMSRLLGFFLGELKKLMRRRSKTA